MNEADTGRVKKSVRGLMLVATVATLLMAACTQDEALEQSTALPEGAYPLQIASVAMSATGNQRPWTRVAESADGNSSTWEGGEIIHLLFNGQETTYKIAADKKTLELEGEQLYWKSTDAQTITAWYPTNGAVNLANQSQNLAYVLTGSGTGDYNKAVELSFTHALAKVRVVFSEESTADLTNASVRILAPTTCTVNKGNVTAGSTIDYIPMHKTTYNGEVRYEANVTPNLVLKDNAFQLTVGSQTVNCTTTEVKTQAGQLHIITLIVNEKYDKVENVSDITKTEYIVDGKVHLKGDGSNKTLKITMNANSKLMLENVNLTAPDNNSAITCNGDATITLKGKNSITSNNIGIYVKAGTLTVNGDDNTSSMTVTGNGYMSGAGIGATNNANITINGGKIKANEGGKQESAGIGSAGWGETCGTITINGGTIESWGGDFSAGIGGSNSGACGDIIITGGNIKAYGGSQSPGIGNGDDASCGNITISGASTEVYAKKGEVGLQKPANPIGWNNYSGSCGTVTIDPECTVTQE